MDGAEEGVNFDVIVKAAQYEQTQREYRTDICAYCVGIYCDTTKKLAGSDSGAIRQVPPECKVECNTTNGHS